VAICQNCAETAILASWAGITALGMGMTPVLQWRAVSVEFWPIGGGYVLSFLHEAGFSARVRPVDPWIGK